MSVENTHPQYDDFRDDWSTMRDCYGGEKYVKGKTFDYLPPTAGMVADGVYQTDIAYGRIFNRSQYRSAEGQQPGANRYLSYLMRAVFYDFVADAVQTAIGLMLQKPTVFELPKAMEPLLEAITQEGESLALLQRKVYEQQLVTGRLGLLADIAQEPLPGQDLPRVSMYWAENITNWDDGLVSDLGQSSLNLVVLNESGPIRDGLTWDAMKRYRILTLGDVGSNTAEGEYRFGVVEGDKTSGDFDDSILIAPKGFRGKVPSEIPFTFINSQDIIASPDDPPLMGLAQLALAIYRGDADYRQTLHEQANATLVTLGIDEDQAKKTLRVGAGARINIPNPDGDAKYIVAPQEGIEAQRLALTDDKMLAANRAGQLIDTRSGQKESAETLKMRVGAQSATLNQIVLSGAAGVEDILKKMARWIGADPDEVKVIPNTDFDGSKMSAAELMELVVAKNVGAPISTKTIHRIMREGDLTEQEFDEEMAEIEGEEDLPTGGGEPDPVLPPEPIADPDDDSGE